MIFESFEDLGIIYISPTCSTCTRLKPTPENLQHCEAFDKIPKAIWNGMVDHTEAYPGDHGLRYSPKVQ